MNKRVIVVSPPEEIDANTVKEFLEVLAIHDSTKGPIEVRIFSPGGHVGAAVAMYDAIQNAQNEITTVGYGFVGSAAVLLLQAGKKRYLSPNSVLYIHEVGAEGGGSLTQMKMHLNETERLHVQYCTLIANRSKVDYETFREMCKQEGFLTPETALKLGLIDGIQGPAKAKTKTKSQK